MFDIIGIIATFFAIPPSVLGGYYVYKVLRPSYVKIQEDDVRAVHNTLFEYIETFDNFF